MFSLFEVSTPQLYLDIDRTKAQLLGINMPDVFNTLQVNIGSSYVNDFNLFGRTFRVQAQADAEYRLQPKDILNLRVRNSAGETVPLGVVHHHPRHHRPVSRAALQPLSGGRARWRGGARLFAGPGDRDHAEARGRDAAATASPMNGRRWPIQQIKAGNTAMFAFVLAVVFVFLVLAAQYESLTLPLAVILIVPMCLIASITGVVLRGQDNNILTQVGFIVLIGLAAKNAILIVEFAKQLEDQGRDRYQAATEAAELRLRPILMTSLAFILGVLPLAIAIGAGAELRQALGTAVVFGMIGVTIFGLIFTPVFYVVVRWIEDGSGADKPQPRRRLRRKAKIADS